MLSAGSKTPRGSIRRGPTVDGMDLEIVTLAERPDLADRLWDFDDLWPEFMTQDPIGDWDPLRNWEPVLT